MLLGVCRMFQISRICNVYTPSITRNKFCLRIINDIDDFLYYFFKRPSACNLLVGPSGK